MLLLEKLACGASLCVEAAQYCMEDSPLEPVVVAMCVPAATVRSKLACAVTSHGQNRARLPSKYSCPPQETTPLSWTDSGPPQETTPP